MGGDTKEGTRARTKALDKARLCSESLQPSTRVREQREWPKDRKHNTDVILLDSKWQLGTK